MKNNMKITLLAVLVTLFSAGSVFGQTAATSDIAEKPSTAAWVASKVLMYVPNRVMDLLDITSWSIGTGVTSKLKVRLTRAFGFGWGIGPSGNLVKAYDRRIGFALDNDGEIFIPGAGIGDIQREYTTGNLIDYWFQYKGMLLPGNPIFARDKAYDYWAIEVEAAAFVGVKFAIHPVEIADFIAGLFFYDGISNDDYELLYNE